MLANNVMKKMRVKWESERETDGERWHPVEITPTGRPDGSALAGVGGEHLSDVFHLFLLHLYHNTSRVFSRFAEIRVRGYG